MTESSESPAQWAIDLLTDRTYDQTPFIERYFIETMSTITAIGLSFWRNNNMRKAWNASLHHHALGGLAGFAFGSCVSLGFRRVWERRNAQLLDYIKLHPDRFPKPDYKPYGELFQPWHPVR
ncbi:NADH dehydrogenase (ubiquinone) B14.5 B subunit [Augochlora pura]